MSSGIEAAVYPVMASIHIYIWDFFSLLLVINLFNKELLDIFIVYICSIMKKF